MRKKELKKSDSTALKETVVQGMQDKKGKDIRVIDLRDFPNAGADYFVICHGQSDRQTDAIAKSVEATVFNTFNINAYHTEGYEQKEWILLDYFDIVAHIFVESKRQFFALEDLWADAPIEAHESFD